jgi:ribonucleoside-diphosphate reductase alpha chain
MNFPQTPRQASHMARGTARSTNNRIPSRGRNANYKTVFGIGHETIVDAAGTQSTSYLLKTFHRNLAEPFSSASENHCSLGTFLHVKKEQRGVMATQTAATAAEAKQYTAAEKDACSIDAMLNAETCEACQ